MQTLLADIRQSLRVLRKSPGFTMVAVAALALGIGANTAIFSVVDKVLLKALPYPQPDRMVRLGRQERQGIEVSNSIPKYMAWRRYNTVFSAMALYDDGGPGLNVGSSGRPEQVKGVHVSAEYFEVFGVHPLIGRTFSAIEDAPNGPKVAMISRGFWASHFGSDPHVTARTLVLNGLPYSIVGVMLGQFVPNPPADIWIPLQADPQSTNQGHYLAVAARLKPGVMIEQARARMKLAGEAFRRIYPKSMNPGESVAVMPMQEALVRDVKPALLILQGAVVFVLLIACANVANLLLARASTRQRELAIRSAIGASRWRIVQQLLTESVVLSLVGGLTGFLLGAWGVKALLAIVPGNIPLLTDEGASQTVLSILDWRVAFFTLAISALTGILFGLFPALHISRPDVASTLKEASGRSGTGRRHNWVKQILVGCEMALALVLLVSATLLIQTFAGLTTANPGIDPHHVLTFQTSLFGERYETTAKVDQLTTQALRRIENIPGVEAACVMVALPTDSEIDFPFYIAGKPPKNGEQFSGDEQWRSVSPHYFAAFKIPLLRGRLLNEHDVQSSAPVVVINNNMAKKYWPKENPIGQVLIIGKGLGPQFTDQPRQIVGVVGDVRETGLDDTSSGVMYLPVSQVPDGTTQLANSALPLSWAVRSPLDAGSLKAAIEREIQHIDASIPVARIRSMEEVLANGVSRQNFNMVLLTIFAGIALALAAIGIYGLMSYSVEQQTQELGIRMALGAGHPELLRLIIRQGMMPTLIGIGTGIAAALGLTRLLASLLYGVKATDPLTFVSVAFILTGIALFSIYIPARRATRLDPVTALRQQ